MTARTDCAAAVSISLEILIIKLLLGIKLSFQPIRPIKRSGITAMKDVVFAIFMRELKTRFGGYKLGYAWVLLEPVAHVLVFSTLFTLRGKEAVSGIDVPLLILTGILPFKFFMGTMNQIANACSSNKALFSYRQVKPIDCVFARALLEGIVFLVSYAVLLVVFHVFVLDVAINDLLMMLLVYSQLYFLAIGFGLLIAYATLKFADTPRFVSLVTTPMFFLSGIFFTSEMIPQQFWPYFSWNPIFQVIEMGRDAISANFNSQFVSYEYVFLLTLFVFSIGLIQFQTNRQRFISS